MEKRVWSDFYTGVIAVIMVSSVQQIPDKARYKYTDENDVSIYSDGDKFWGVIL